MTTINPQNSAESNCTVGLIGLGAMGNGMAQSLRRAGYSPYVFDLRSEIAVTFAKDGGTACATLNELGSSCDVIVCVVVNAAQTESVLFGTVGCAASMKPGSVFVMCSTVDPNWSVALEARLASLGILYIDAPISENLPALSGRVWRKKRRLRSGKSSLLRLPPSTGHPPSAAHCNCVRCRMAHHLK